MSALSKAKKSRDQWKAKSIARGAAERYERQEKLRIKKERDKYKQTAKEALTLLEEERKKKAQ